MLQKDQGVMSCVSNAGIHLTISAWNCNGCLAACATLGPVLPQRIMRIWTARWCASLSSAYDLHQAVAFHSASMC